MSPVSVQSGISYQQETFQWMFTHIAVVRDLVAMQYKEYQEVPHLHHYQTWWMQENQAGQLQMMNQPHSSAKEPAAGLNKTIL